MDDLKSSLNYHFNFNLLLTKQLIYNLKKEQDRESAISWTYFLMKTDQKLAEMQLRNEFMNYLVANLQEGFLRPPFNTSPSTSTKLMDMANLIPGRKDNFNIEEDSDEDVQSEISDNDGPTVMSKSPDGGAFLSLQPVPHEGSFCYLAITTKKKTT